jgi:hypothetical protein
MKNPRICSLEINSRFLRQSRVASVTLTPIDEPRPDWIRLDRASFYCTSDGFFHNRDSWNEAATNEVRRVITINLVKFRSPPLEVPADLNFESFKNIPRIALTALGLRLTIEPGCMRLSQPEDETYTLPLLISVSPDSADDVHWTDFPAEVVKAAQWYQSLIRELFYQWRRNLNAALRSNAAFIIARKQNVLAPFERVHWDQWQYFNVDELQLQPPKPFWAPKYGFSPATAIGPNGERLYSIFVCAGNRIRDRQGPEEKCQRWVLGLLHDHPKRAPAPLAELAKQAIAMFPGLSKRGFWRSLERAQAEAKIFAWSLPGAPQKSSRKSPQQ